MHFEASQAIFWSLPDHKDSYKEAVYRLYTSQSSVSDANCRLLKFECAQKAKSWLRQFCGLKVTHQSWLLLFTFSLPLFFLFSCLVFSVCWSFTRLCFVNVINQETLLVYMNPRKISCSINLASVLHGMRHSIGRNLPFSLSPGLNWSDWHLNTTLSVYVLFVKTY